VIKNSCSGQGWVRGGGGVLSQTRMRGWGVLHAQEIKGRARQPCGKKSCKTRCFFVYLGLASACFALNPICARIRRFGSVWGETNGSFRCWITVSTSGWAFSTRMVKKKIELSRPNSIFENLKINYQIQPTQFACVKQRNLLAHLNFLKNLQMSRPTQDLEYKKFENRVEPAQLVLWTKNNKLSWASSNRFGKMHIKLI